MGVSAMYMFLGNANASGGMTTILQGIRDMDEEISRLGREAAAREANGEAAVVPEQSSNFQGMVALRMCPFVWIGTVSTHLFGGSAGREGSALQMAAAIFSKYTDMVDIILRKMNPRFGLSVQFKRAGLVAAIASGFSGIFGVPITGAIFAIEVLRVGELTIGEMLTPAVVGSVFGDLACRYVNEFWFNFEGHSRYPCESCQGRQFDGQPLPADNQGQPQNWFAFLDYTELLNVLLAAFFFGLCGYAFEWLMHHFKDIFGQIAGKLGRGNAKAKTLLTPFVGGWVIVLFWLGLCGAATTASFNLAAEYDGTDPYSSTFGQAYLGLSVYEPGVSITSCFLNRTATAFDSHPGVSVMKIEWYSWLIKLMLTTITLGAGFKGGEVTPLFFIGAALGNWVGMFLGQDVQLFAALGLVSVFAAAANTPIACTFMGIELFGGSKAIAFFVSCYFAYVVSNTEAINGIYKQAQPRGPVGAVAPYSRRRPQLV
jgi:H+/Cl- antiporter ClcA